MLTAAGFDAEAAYRAYGVRLTRLSAISPKARDWLWAGWIPFGEITILEGHPEKGKSLITVDLGARLSSGRPMPGEQVAQAPAGVIVLATEDDPEATLRPRFDAAGADQSRIFLLDGFEDTDECLSVPVLTQENCARLEKCVAALGVRLIVIDPIMNYLPSDVDSYKDQEIRRLVLSPLTLVARHTGAAVLLVRHLAKGGGAAITRGAGSMGIVGTSRSAIAVSGAGPRFTLKSVKSNLADKAEPLQYTIRAAPNGSGVLHWDLEVAADLPAAPLGEENAPDVIERRTLVALSVALEKGAVSARTAFEADRTVMGSLATADRTLRDLRDRGLLGLSGRSGSPITDDGRAFYELHATSSSSPLIDPPA